MDTKEKFENSLALSIDNKERWPLMKLVKKTRLDEKAKEEDEKTRNQMKKVIE